VAIGPVGEIYIAGAAPARGYLHHPELTAERFVQLPAPAAPAAPGGRTARAYRTGDLARWRPDGSLQFIGRADDQLKIRGFRVEPGEIEAALARHRGIAAAVVVGHTAGSGDKVLVAYYVPRDPGSPPAAAELQQALGEALPEYMVPSLFVKLAALPLTPSGKLDRRALPAPSVDRADLETEYVAPSNDVERALAGAWSRILEFDLVGIHDSFFDLGGHSLRATQLLAWIVERFGVEITQRRLFEAPTIAALAQYIEQAGAAAPDGSGGDRDGADQRVSGEL